MRAYTPTGGASDAPSPVKGLTASALGLIGLDEDKTKPRVVLTRSTGAHRPLLSYGLGEGEGTLALRLPTRARIYDQGAKSRLRAWPLEFGRAQRWAIPTESDYLQAPRIQSAGQSKSGVLREFLLTSSREYIPLPGYLLEGNGRQHEFFARGQLRGGLDSWSVTDGKMARQNEAAPRLGESVALGDAAQGALVSLEPTRAYYAFTGRRAALLLAAALLIYAATLSLLCRAPGDDEAGDALPADGAWHLLWVGALLIALVRAITAYRVSLLPPADASLYQLSAMFNDSLRQSLWLIFWAPSAVAMARFVAALLEPQRRIQPWLPTGLGATLALLMGFNGARLDAQWPALAALFLVTGTLALAWLRASNTQLGARICKSTSVAASGGAKAAARPAFWQTPKVALLQIAMRAFIGVCAIVVAVWAFQSLRGGFSALTLVAALVIFAGLALWFLARQWRFWLVSAWMVPTLILVGIDKGFKALPGSPNLMAIVALTLALAVSARLIYRPRPRPTRARVGRRAAAKRGERDARRLRPTARMEQRRHRFDSSAGGAGIADFGRNFGRGFVHPRFPAVVRARVWRVGATTRKPRRAHRGALGGVGSGGRIAVVVAAQSAGEQNADLQRKQRDFLPAGGLLAARKRHSARRRHGALAARTGFGQGAAQLAAAVADAALRATGSP